MPDVEPACLYLTFSNAGCSGLSDSSIIFKTECFVLFGVFSVPVINKRGRTFVLIAQWKPLTTVITQEKSDKKSTWLVKKHSPIKKLMGKVKNSPMSLSENFYVCTTNPVKADK